MLPPLVQVELPVDPQLIIALLVITIGAIASYLKQRQETRRKDEQVRSGRRADKERAGGRLPPRARAETEGTVPPLEPTARRRGADARPSRAEIEARIPELEPLERPRGLGGAPGEPRTPSRPQRMPSRRPRTPEELVEELRRRAEARQTPPPRPTPARRPAPPAPVRRPTPVTTILPGPPETPLVELLVEPLPLSPVLETPGDTTVRVQKLLTDPADLQAAIVLSEVLGPPVGLRDLGV